MVRYSATRDKRCVFLMRVQLLVAALRLANDTDTRLEFQFNAAFWAKHLKSVGRE